MSVGLKVWDERGNITLDTTDYTARLIYSGVKAGTTSGSETISEAVGKMPIVLTYPGPNNTGEWLLIVGISPDGVLTWQTVENLGGSVVSGETSIAVYVCYEQWVIP